MALAYGPFIQNLVVTEIDYREGAADAQLAFSREYRYNSGKNMGMCRSSIFRAHALQLRLRVSYR